MQEAVRKFHLESGLESRRTPHPMQERPNFMLEFRSSLIKEETEEALEALASGSLVEISKELADVLYVVFGTAVALGIDLEEIFYIVHESNLEKLSSIERREDGKILKGKNYRDPKERISFVLNYSD